MARLTIDKAGFIRLAGRAFARYMEFVHRNSRIVIEPANLDEFVASLRPSIVVLWHGQFLLTPLVKPQDEPFVALLARHDDAEYFAEALAKYNVTLIRGAGAVGRKKDRGGTYVLRASLKALQEGKSIVSASDPPPGPVRHVSEGLITMARMSGRPVIPMAVATSRYFAFPTRSRMTLNLPYGTLAGVLGPPVWVARDADEAALEGARLEVEASLNKVTARAYELAGADPRRSTPPRRKLRRAKYEPPGLGLKAYALATRMLQPAAPLLIRARERQQREDGARRQERYGIASKPRPPGRLVWIHAASVGEFNAALPLANAMRARRSDLTFLFTTGTVTSAAVAAERLAPGDLHQYVPLDTPAFMQRFLQHWQPDIAVLTESEIWPNMVMEIADRGIPLALVNARMSDRSFERWRRRPRMSRPLFSRFDVVLAQSEALRERFRVLGASKSIAVGNLKIDAPPPVVNDIELANLGKALDGRPAYVAASTHDGEERIIAAAHRLLAQRHAGFLTIIAPRHPERGTEIAEMLKGTGLTVAQRSLRAAVTSAVDVYVADTIGELGTFFALTPIAFLGGSLIARGGQNPIEAIRRDCAVISGPSVYNFREAYGALAMHDGAVVVKDATELAGAVSRLLVDPNQSGRMRAGARAALDTLAGALDRTVSELVELVPKAKELRRAG